jgi:hypothetical protein
MLRARLVAGLAATLSLVVLSAPAYADDADTYTATINCGAGPVVVVSGEDMYAPLVSQKSGRRYHPDAFPRALAAPTLRDTNRRLASPGHRGSLW